MKLLEENIELMLHETGFGNDFWIWHQRHKQQQK